MEIILHTTDCPKCRILEKKLDQNGIKYHKNDDIQAMIDAGFREAPLLQIDEDTFLTFPDAAKWINTREVR